MSDALLPGRCPSCGQGLRVVRLQCPSCRAQVEGEFDPCPVCRLDPEARRSFDLFMAARGNVRRVQHELGVSYPTARLRLAEMFAQLEGRRRPVEAKEVLDRLKRGEISVDQAEALLRGD